MKSWEKAIVIGGVALGVFCGTGATLKAQDDKNLLQKVKKEIVQKKREKRRELTDSLVSLKDDASYSLNRMVDNYNSAETPQKRKQIVEIMVNFYKGYLNEYSELCKMYDKEVVMATGKKDLVSKLWRDWNVDVNRIRLNVKTEDMKFKSNEYFKGIYKKTSEKTR